jgi:hypothetical protein
LAALPPIIASSSGLTHFDQKNKMGTYGLEGQPGLQMGASLFAVSRGVGRSAMGTRGPCGLFSKPSMMAIHLSRSL